MQRISLTHANLHFRKKILTPYQILYSFLAYMYKLIKDIKYKFQNSNTILMLYMCSGVRVQEFVRGGGGGENLKVFLFFFAFQYCPAQKIAAKIIFPTKKVAKVFFIFHIRYELIICSDHLFFLNF